MSVAPAGWYPDPITPGVTRYWDGSAWTQHVFWGPQRATDPTPLTDVAEREAHRHRGVVGAYLDDATARGMLDEATRDRLRADLESPAAAARLAQPVALRTARRVAPAAAGPIRTPVTAPAPAPASVSASSSAPNAEWAPPATTPTDAHGQSQQRRPARPEPRAPEPVESIAPIERRPGRVALWIARTRHAVSSDLGVHWLAYLGVLLLFAGVIGLVVVSTGDVEPALRPVAEVASPLAFFLGAWFLRRRRAETVAAALTLLGGAVFPVVAIASLTDGAGFPPDLDGVALPVASAVLCAVLACAYALVARRSPTSPLRFVAGPTLWLGVGVGAAVLRDPIPVGQDVARPIALQIAAMLLAVAVTMAAIRLVKRDGAIAHSTTLVAAPIAVLLVVVEAVLARNEGWPVASGLVAMASAVAVLEMLAGRLPHAVVTVGQAVGIFVAGARLSPEVEVPWLFAGVAVALLAFLEYVGARRASAVGLATTGVLGVVASLLSLSDPASGICTFSLLLVWSLLRRSRRASWIPVDDRFGISCGVAGIVVISELWVFTSGAVAVSVLAVLAAAGAVAAVPVVGLRKDPLWRWSVPVAALVSSIGAAAVPWDESRWLCAAAVLVASAAIAGSALPLVVRVWLSAGSTVWALVLFAAAAQTPSTMNTIVLAAVAGVLVIVGSLVNTTVTVQLGYAGHLLGGAAIAVALERDWDQAVAVLIVSASWLAVGILHELRGAHHVECAVRVLCPDTQSGSASRTWIDSTPMLIGSAGAALSALLVLDQSGAVRLGSDWTSAAIAGIAVALAAATRFVPWRRARRGALGYESWLLSLAAIAVAVAPAVDARRWPLIVMLAGGMVVSMAVTPPPPLIELVAWVESVAVVALLVIAAGVDERWSSSVLGAWGALLAIGALSVRRVMARRAAAGASGVEGPRRWVAPLAVGSLSFVAGAATSLVGKSEVEVGWHLIAAAVPLMVIALLVPLAPLLAAPELAATAGLVLVLPWDAREHPWSLVAWSTLLMVGAWLTRSVEPRRPHERWDLPSFVSAHLVLVAAITLAAVRDSIAITFGPAAALLLAVGVVLRSGWWPGASVVLILIASRDLGEAWFALALALEGIGSTALGFRVRERLRALSLGVGAVLLGGAWAQLLVWVDWTVATAAFWTTAAASVVLVASAVAERFGVRPRAVSRIWLVAGIGWAIASHVLLLQPGVPSRTGALLSAWCLASVAGGAGLAAVNLGQWSRWVAALGAALTGIRLVDALDVAPDDATYLAAGAAVGMAGLALLLWARRPASMWVGPSLGAVVVVGLVTFLTGLDEMPARGPMVVALLALAVVVGAVATVLQRPEFTVLSPVLACTAWIVWVSAAWDGDPNWYSAPIGITLLIITGMIRWIRRSRGGRVTARDVSLLEIVGMAVVVGPPLQQTVSGHLGYSLVAVGAGIAFAAWGGATRVLRRAVAGTVMVVLTVLLLVAVPLAREIPRWRGPALWLVLIGLGAVALLIAGFFEQSRTVVRRWRSALREVTRDWEHVGGPEAHHPDILIGHRRH